MDITATTAAASLGVHHRPQGPPPPKLDGTAELLGEANNPEGAPQPARLS
jgi:hypothetical protein